MKTEMLVRLLFLKNISYLDTNFDVSLLQALAKWTLFRCESSFIPQLTLTIRKNIYYVNQEQIFILLTIAFFAFFCGVSTRDNVCFNRKLKSLVIVEKILL